MPIQNEATNPVDDVWSEDPVVAYKNYLKYAGADANEAVAYNRQALTLFGAAKKEKSDDMTVHAHNGKFYPLKGVLGIPAKCSKITIRNLSNASLKFQFEEDILPGILGIDTRDPCAAESIQVAYRNIVPSMFANATSLAGPMGFHEYIIDGNDYKSEYLALSFHANSDFEATPLNIVLENCEGYARVEGLNTEQVKRVFENKCPAKKYDAQGPSGLDFEHSERPRNLRGM